MGDTTAFQAYIYACPDDQRAAAGAIMDESRWDSVRNLQRYAVIDNTLNSDGKPIRRGQDPLQVSIHKSEEAAAAAIVALPGNTDDPARYDIEPVGIVNLDRGYSNWDISLGSADHYASWLVDAAPGCSFVIWEDPKYEYLGSLFAYTPELGMFSAECDADGTPVTDGSAILQWVEEAEKAGEDVATRIRREMGVPWFDDWANARKAGA